MNPFEGQLNFDFPFTSSGLPNQKQTLYDCIMQNIDLKHDFFQDSPSEEEEAGQQKLDDGDHSEDSGEEDIGTSFKFNEDHCLHVFNTLKNGGAGNQFDMQRGCFNNTQNGAYINLNG